MAVGIRPPSSSRIRARPSSSASSSGTAVAQGGPPSPQRRTRIASSNVKCASASATPAPSPLSSPSVPLESVVIRNDVGLKAPAADAIEGGSVGEKTTNVRVCVRLRPLLASDFNNNAAADGFGGAPAASAPQLPAAPSRGRGFARDTASSHIHRHTPRKTSSAAAGRKRASGLAAPSATSPRSRIGGGGTAMAPSWITHPEDRGRITQSAHADQAPFHDPERLADYSFDRVYSPDEPTRSLYEESVRGVVESVVEGFHGSVFAYGQTSSGKTHTMTGSPMESGVVRLAVQDIFNRIRSQSAITPREYLVRVSYLEIYNEQIYDLLTSQSSSPGKFKSALQHHHLPPSTAVRIFESRAEGVVVRGLREEIATCPEDVFRLLDSGDTRRKVGSTGMNRTSSRSHSVFRLVLESRASIAKGGMNSNGNGSLPALVPSSNSSLNSDADSITTGRSSAAVRGPVRISSLSLVDLAGSESLKATGSTGVRQREGQYINKSLLTLGHVVHKLSEMGSREKKEGGVPASKEHIPYRDSKLTRLLQPSLGGNAQVCVICNVSPAPANLEESHNTLKFAARAKKIKQHAKITEVADEKTLLRSYREEIEELKRQLKEAKKTAAEAQQVEGRQQAQRLPKIEDGSSSDDEDQDDTHVLVSAITNLESLILKAGAKSTRKATNTTGGSTVGTSEADDSLPSRALDAALRRAEFDIRGKKADTVEAPSSPEAAIANTQTVQRTPSATAHNDDDEADDLDLLGELHRIQGMLGTVMKKKRKGGGDGGGGMGLKSMPERDAEVERLRLQLQEQEVASTMRKADSSFLQGQLSEKEGILKEVSVLLEALEKRQVELESENKQLRADLAEATVMIGKGDKDRKLLEDKLADKEAQLSEKRDIVFVEHTS